MKVVSDNFETAQREPGQNKRRAVYYKRRYWDQSTRTYVWEDDWTLLPLSEVVSISPVSWRLDTEQLNEFKVSNVTLVVENADNRWLPSNRFGFFKKDSVSPLFQYEPYWTKFQIRAGFELYDGTEELVNVFTGVATEYQYDSTTSQCQITIQGLEALLINTKAEGIGTTVTQENAGTGDGSETEFTTLNPGVGGVTIVSVAGITQVEGADYSVAQLNEETLGAKVTFTDAPDVGEIVRISYFYWPLNQEFHDLVGLLLDAAGIEEAKQLVDPVVFENSVISTQEYTSQADWDGGTKTDVETVLSPGSVKVDFNSNTFKTATNYQNSMSGWTVAPGGDTNWTSDGSKLDLLMGASELFESRIYRSSSAVTGVWEFKFRLTNSSAAGSLNFFFMGETTPSFNLNGSNYIRLNLNLSRIQLVTGLSSSFVTFTKDTSQHTIKVSRTGAGLFRVYLDGSLIITVTNNEITSSVTVGFSGDGATTTIEVDDISVPTSEIDGAWTSATIDMASTPSSWGVFEFDDDDDGATLTYQTRTSTDGISWDSWLTVSGQGVPQSALKRYAQARVLIDKLSTDNFDPSINSISFRWVTSGVPVVLPEFAGSTVYDAIQKLGQFTLYEFGFTPDEDFFFRPKTSGSSVMTLSQKDFISRVGGMRLGYEEVYGTVRVTYGDVTREVTDDGLNPDSPSAKVSGRRYEFSADSGIQIEPTADIATGVAQSLFKRLSRPRKRLLVTTKFIPQLDLSDVVDLELVNNTPEPLWYIGDPSAYIGDPSIYLWGDDEQMLPGVEMKIIGARYDLQNWSCEFEVEETL